VLPGSEPHQWFQRCFVSQSQATSPANRSSYPDQTIDTAKVDDANKIPWVSTKGRQSRRYAKASAPCQPGPSGRGQDKSTAQIPIATNNPPSLTPRFPALALLRRQATIRATQTSCVASEKPKPKPYRTLVGRLACCDAVRRRRHSPRVLDSSYVEFTPSRS
jgi:hypothetical protein